MWGRWALGELEPGVTLDKGPEGVSEESRSARQGFKGLKLGIRHPSSHAWLENHTFLTSGALGKLG